MLRTSQPAPAPFESILFGRSGRPPHGKPAETDVHWVLYVGLGDQFDDDRRLIRAAEPAADAA
jgi:hypothetical protein